MQLPFNKIKLNIMVKRTKLDRFKMNTGSLYRVCLHSKITRLKYAIYWKLEHKRRAFKQSQIHPFRFHISFNKSMRKDFFHDLKRAGFTAQYRYGNGNGARDVEFFKLMKDYNMKSYKLNVKELDDNDDNGFITVFTKDSNTDNLNNLINNTESIKILLETIGQEALEYIINNNLLCIAIYEQNYYERIEYIEVYSKDAMSIEYYDLMHY